MECIKNFFKFTFDFVGVCGRKEFWKTVIAIVLFQVVLFCLTLLGPIVQFVVIITLLILFVPILSLSARRLHDTDRSALNLFWLLVPVFGAIIILIYTAEKTKYVIN